MFWFYGRNSKCTGPFQSHQNIILKFIPAFAVANDVNLAKPKDFLFATLSHNIQFFVPVTIRFKKGSSQSVLNKETKLKGHLNF